MLNKYFAPHISFRGNELVLYWRHKDRQLGLFFDENGLEFLETWGINIYDDMAEYKIKTFEEFKILWDRLVKE